MKLQSIYTGMLVAVFAFFAIPAQAQLQQPQQSPQPQIELSDEELRLFMDSAMLAQALQMESQQKMVEVVDDEGFEIEKFNEIIQAQQMGQSVDELDITAEEKSSFESAMVKIQEIEVEMGEQITDAVEENGMEMDRFQQINMAISQDPELQQRAQQMIQEMQMQPQQPENQPEQQ